MRRAEREAGVALLEVLAAVTIFATAALALLALVAGAGSAAWEARARERELADQERLLAAYALLTRRDLDLRLGARRVGDYVVMVQRPERQLYRVGIGRVETPAVEDLVTVVYRSEDGDGG